MSFLIFYCMSSYGTLFNNQKRIAFEVPSFVGIAAMQPIVKEWAGKRSIVLSLKELTPFKMTNKTE